MKQLVEFLFPTFKAVFQVCIFMAGIGWGSYGVVLLIVKAEGNEIRREVKTIRDVDMGHLDYRFNRLENLIREHR